MIVIPSIDLRGGRCVRLLRGDFNNETCYDTDPLDLAQRHRATGFSHLHVVDLDGALTGEQQHQELVSRIAVATGLVVQVGGGIRKRDSLARWLGMGVSRCVIGSLAVTDPHRVEKWLNEFGPEQMVLALDVHQHEGDMPTLATHGWTRSTGLTLWQCLDRYRSAGLKHVLCTDIGVDGALAGPNLPLYREVLGRYPDIALQASGGVRHLADLQALGDLGCAAAITGRALLDRRIGDEEMSSFLRNA
jgi:phosphoribosylformimino-5-aminoimidazole carboxamide ribotide isomerase